VPNFFYRFFNFFTGILKMQTTNGGNKFDPPGDIFGKIHGIYHACISAACYGDQDFPFVQNSRPIIHFMILTRLAVGY
jgi:hypothetical protein